MPFEPLVNLGRARHHANASLLDRDLQLIERECDLNLIQMLTLDLILHQLEVRPHQLLGECHREKKEQCHQLRHHLAVIDRGMESILVEQVRRGQVEQQHRKVWQLILYLL